MKRKGWVSGFVCFFLFSVLGIQIPTLAQNVLPGFSSGILDRNDDGSTGLTPIGFNINFFGATYDHLYVNNNGNVTFTGPLWTFDPAGLDLSSTAVIAAFFGDVDTRSAPSGIVTYGPGTFLSRSAFGATWNQVGYYSHGTDKLNTFQIVLVDRSDIAAGDFDIYLRYDQIQWDTSATHDTVASRVGYSNGTDTSYEAPGSGVVGAQVDGGPQSLVTRRILLFQVRSGVVIVVDPNLIKIIRLRPFVNFSRTESSHALAAGLDAAPNGLLPRILNDILDPDVMAAMLESLVPYEAALPTQILFDGFQRAHSAFTTAQPVKAPTDKPGVNERLW
ncbi:MAG: nidogen-like domain-containing protein, partial [Kiritimatiellia bacterium]|nr:nidogen-like domain-containing protein [Kiritimatiellia bacterium]